MPDLFKLLARNLVMGTIAGWMTLALLIATNFAGLYDVVFASATPVLPLAILAFGFFITFGSLSMGAAVMMLPYGKGDGKDRGGKEPTFLARLLKVGLGKKTGLLHANRDLAPVRVKAGASRRNDLR